MLEGVIHYDNIPGVKAQGPYTPVVVVVTRDSETGVEREIAFTSGFGTYDPDIDGKYTGDDMGRQADLAVGNLRRALRGITPPMDLGDVAQMTLFTTATGDRRDKIISRCATSFPDPAPAVTVVPTRQLAGGMAVMVDATAVRVVKSVAKRSR